METQNSTASLHDWLQTPLGQYLLARERDWFDETTPDIFGYHALQLGMPALDLLSESRIAHKFSVDLSSQATVRAAFHALPIDTQSVDLCVLPHVLEFSAKPHEILREIDRVMIPEGRILITGFNPWSLFGVKRLWQTEGYPWCGQFVSLVRIKDWLQLLGFEVSAAQLAGYVPPCASEKWISRLRFLEPAGSRYWGVAGGVYMIEAIKRVQGMRVITPAWNDAKMKERKLASASNRNKRYADSAKPCHLKVVK